MLQTSERTSFELLNVCFTQHVSMKHVLHTWILVKGKEEQEEDQKVGQKILTLKKVCPSAANGDL